MTDIKPIETFYRGYRFRSRLEARWAVFFDTLKIGWEYEPEAFDLDGVGYLPDFRLAIDGAEVFAEVKPEPAPRSVFLKADLLAEAGKHVVFLMGAPDVLEYPFRTGERVKGDLPFSVESLRLTKQGFFLTFNQGRGLEDAVAAARSARFEHLRSAAQSTRA